MQIKQFLDDNAALFPSSATQTCVVCMDDRKHEKDVSATRYISVPGAGLGLIMDVLATAQRLRVSIDPKLVYEIGAQVLPGVTYHTDTGHGAHSPHAWGGCGYVNAPFENMDDFFLSPEAKEFLLSEGQQLADESMKAHGYSVPAYEGSHVGKAICLIEDDAIWLPSEGKDGTRVYTVHTSFYKNTLETIATRVHEASDMVLSLQDWIQEVHNTAGMKLALVKKKLQAEHLPVFRIYQENGRILGERINQEKTESTESTSV